MLVVIDVVIVSVWGEGWGRRNVGEGQILTVLRMLELILMFRRDCGQAMGWIITCYDEKSWLR